MKNHLSRLGYRAVDIVTGFEGVIESVSFDLYGCVQAILRPAGEDKEGNTKRGEWFDVKRLKITSQTRVMPIPDFDLPEQGPAAKPDPRRSAR